MESNMLENGLIHLLDAVNRLDEPIVDNTCLKYAVVHLCHGLKLLLKKRLFDEHWSLIYEDIAHPNHPKDSLNSIVFEPISFISLKDRLCTFCGIDITEYIDILVKLRKDYKKIELNQFMGSKTQIISNMVQIWPFIVDFVSKHIDFSHDMYAESLFNQTCEIMESHLKFVHEIKKETIKILFAQSKTAYYAKPLVCPECLQTAIPLLADNNTQIRCEFCNHVIHWKELAVVCGFYLNQYLGPFDCLDCECKGLIQTEDRWVCLSCCSEWNLEHFNICQSCETRLVLALHDEPYCKYCVRHH